MHEIGQAPVVRSADESPSTRQPIHYIAMELVDGVTLKHKIRGER